MALSLVELPIPTKVAMLLKDKGITTLYPPQEEAVKKGIFKKKNLVMAAPTASGKTLIAELVMLKNIFENRGKAIYLVPLRAIASEKYKEFKKYEEIGIKVAITTGDYDSSDQWLANYDIIITTNEKADSLLRHNPSWINNIAVIVADEIHLINDEDRGP
ncbi:MAG: DEAD/DEAH box helicase, partial [Candidatus Asgardarchaeia archaeon]